MDTLRIVRSSLEIRRGYPRVIAGTGTETETFINGFIDAGSNLETQTPIRRLLRRLMQSGLIEDLQKVATAGEGSNQNRLNARSLRLIQNGSRFASLSDSPKGN
jgi:hypothetical protein